MLAEIATSRLKETAAEAKPLKLRSDVEFEYFALKRESWNAIAPVGRISCDGLIEIEHDKARSPRNGVLPPPWPAPGDHLLQLSARDDAPIGVAPGRIMHLSDFRRVLCARSTDCDDCFDHNEMLTHDGAVNKGRRAKPPNPDEVFAGMFTLPARRGGRAGEAISETARFDRTRD